MQVLVVGSGPAGLILGAALGGRGHHVISVDRDPGPSPDGWRRRGVMQFAHAHNFRPQVGKLLAQEWPAAYDAWMRLGATPIEAGPMATDPTMRGVLSRRETLERALREAAEQQAGLELRTGHVDGLVVEGGRVRGAVVDGTTVDADLVVDASGRAGRVGSRARGERVADQLGGDCGLAYVDRTYRLREGAAPGPDEHAPRFHRRVPRLPVPASSSTSADTSPSSWSGPRPTPSSSCCTRRLRSRRPVPPSRSWPSGPTLREPSRPRTSSWEGPCATSTAARRSSPAWSPSATRSPRRPRRAAAASPWPACRSRRCCDSSTRAPTRSRWRVPSTRGARRTSSRGWPTTSPSTAGWSGAGRARTSISSAPLTSDLIADAVQAEPRIAPYAAGYFMMTALPATLQPAEPLARAVYERGWRPPLAEGPSRDELVEIIQRQPAAAGR